jgi:hypothetical protein
LLGCACSLIHRMCARLLGVLEGQRTSVTPGKGRAFWLNVAGSYFRDSEQRCQEGDFGELG